VAPMLTLFWPQCPRSNLRGVLLSILELAEGVLGKTEESSHARPLHVQNREENPPVRSRPSAAPAFPRAICDQRTKAQPASQKLRVDRNRFRSPSSEGERNRPHATRAGVFKRFA